MKKVIFLAIAAAAALTACSKSEVIDSKYGNDQIGFQTYLGRDAQTKATPVEGENGIKSFGLYGFYTGAQEWSPSTTPNLWNNTEVSKGDKGWAPTETKYWTNATDFYTFLAYAPFASTTNGLTATKAADPTVTYTVPAALDKQIDLLYANTPAVDGQGGHVNMVKPENNTVTLNFKHALSRLTVKASEAEEFYDYTIYGIKLSGKFVQTQTFNIKNGAWVAPAADQTLALELEPYVFLPETEDADGKLVGIKVPDTRTPAEGTAPKPHDFAEADNYLMIIPVDLSAKQGTDEAPVYPDAATLTITYTTTFENFESKPMTKSVMVPQNFVQGSAYTLNLVFAPNTTNPILFDVTVDKWGEEMDATVTPNNPENGK